MTRLSLCAVALAVLTAACDRGASDERLTARVNARLAEEARPSAVTVEADDRIVTLKGVVQNRGEHERLVNAVRSVEGVVAIDDQLVVQAPVTTTGAELERDRELAGVVNARLHEAGFTDLRVEARGGVVTVSGGVPYARHDEMRRVVEESPSVVSVDDETTLLVPSR